METQPHWIALAARDSCVFRDHNSQQEKCHGEWQTSDDVGALDGIGEDEFCCDVDQRQIRRGGQFRSDVTVAAGPQTTVNTVGLTIDSGVVDDDELGKFT